MKRAAFLVYQDPITKLFTAVTRPDDDSASIGLPGGKVEPNEDEVTAALREAREEGIAFEEITAITFLYTRTIDNCKVYWYKIECDRVFLLEEYLERARDIQPILVDLNEITSSGYSNELLSLFF